VILEMDSWEWHGNRPARRRDNKRDRVLAGAGYTVVRAFVEELGDELAAEIRALIG
jgi:very-short-patch-repair endonuclease